MPNVCVIKSKKQDTSGNKCKEFYINQNVRLTDDWTWKNDGQLIIDLSLNAYNTEIFQQYAGALLIVLIQIQALMAIYGRISNWTV
jgi:hypothetical protein